MDASAFEHSAYSPQHAVEGTAYRRAAAIGRIRTEQGLAESLNGQKADSSNIAVSHGMSVRAHAVIQEKYRVMSEPTFFGLKPKPRMCYIT